MNEFDEFVRQVTRRRTESESPETWVDFAQERLACLLEAESLPPLLAGLQERRPEPGPVLLHRSTGLTVFVMTSPPGFVSAVHDHGSCGIVGQLAGEEEEAVYRPIPMEEGRTARLELVGTRRLQPRDIVAIYSPGRDVHRVTTIGTRTSVTVHVFADDIVSAGFSLYEPKIYEVRPFVGTYRNEKCSLQSSASE